jgi:hypothetical protein
MTGDWWDMDLDQLDRNMLDGFFSDNQKASMINGKLGDLYNCSGKIIIEVFLQCTMPILRCTNYIIWIFFISLPAQLRKT